MKKEIADMWVEALRSGKYRQGQGGLRSSRGYCCLGVLCDLATSHIVLQIREFNSVLFYDGAEAYPPDSVRHWSGLQSLAGDYDSKKFSLVGQNDGGASFETVAALIEKNWENL